MELSEIRSTEKNHKQHDIKCDGLDFYKGSPASIALDMNEDISRYFQSACGPTHTHDWGADYAGWLKRLGFIHESANGWWSLAAINHANLTAFVKDYTDETGEYSDKIANIVRTLHKIKKTHQVKTICKTVDELLEKSEAHDGKY